MEKAEGKPHQSLRTNTGQSSFRKLVTTISEHLVPEEVARCAFLHTLPKARCSTALDVLNCLIQNGLFSRENVEPLAKLLRDINRHDLVDEVEEYRRVCMDPIGSKAQCVPEQTNTAAISLPTQETEPESVLPASTMPSPPHPDSASNLLEGTVTAPIDVPKSRLLQHQNQGKPPFLDNVAKSLDELEPYNQQRSNSQHESHMHRLELSSALPIETSTFPRTARSNIRRTSAGTPSPHLSHGQSLSNSGTSTPNAVGEIGSLRHGSLPKGLYRAPSEASGYSEASFSREAMADDQSGKESFEDTLTPSSLPFKAADDDSNPQQHTEDTVPALFRKRLGSRGRILSKLTRSRSRSSSIIAWSVKRKKLNEIIYDHLKEKLFKCPQKLELEDRGKHLPRLTLYLHPYGYEDDAQNNLTLTLELDISVKCHIPSSAVIKVEVVATNGSDGTELKRDYISCSPDQRIARCKAFLSHKQLKELECETIDFRASAKLYSATSSTN